MNPEPRVDDGCRILAHLTGADRMMNGAAMLLHEMLDFIAGPYVRSRRELAEAQGVPPYVIFHDSTLVEMCSVVPRTLDDFSRLSGVGERKLMKYGEAFLAAIRDAEQTFQ